MNELLFSPIRMGALASKKRLTMAPLCLGCAGEGGTVSDLLLEHYAGDQGPAGLLRALAARQAAGLESQVRLTS
jgi:2,4-dienoyl-CoA reductase-like NADH-dependent reductase (Old Yellow Enzyme family)